MEKSYHAILLDTEFSDSSFIDKWKLLGKKKSRTNQWWQLKVEVPENMLEELINEGQRLLLSDKFYFHAYNENELVIIFPKKVFYVNQDRSDWKELIEYGRSLGIPEDQMDIKPVKFSEESY